MVLRTHALAIVTWCSTRLSCCQASRSFIENALYCLCLSDIDVALGRSLDYFGADVSAITQLDLGWNEIRFDIEVDQSPMLQECVQPDYTADVTRQLLAAFSRWQVRIWVLSVHLDDIIPVIEICLRILVWKLIAEELWKRLHLQFMDGRKVEPLGAARNNERLLLVLLLDLNQQLFFGILVSFAQMNIFCSINFIDITLINIFIIHFSIIIFSFFG